MNCRLPRACRTPASARSTAWRTAGRPGSMSRRRWPRRRPSSASSRTRRPRRSPRAAHLELLDRARIDEGFARTGHTIVPLVWELGRVVGEPHGGWVHWGATTQNITQTGDLLVLRQAHGLPRSDRRCAPGDGRPRRARRRHADRRAHPRPARGAGDLRLQGRGLDRRADPPRRAAASGGAAHFRRDAGRRRRHLCLARRAGAGGAGRHRQTARLAADEGAVARDRRPPGREHLPARPAGRDLRQDRPRDLHPDEDRVRRGRGAGAARHGRQLDDAAKAQPEAVPGHHRRRRPRCARWCRWRWRRCRPSTRPTAPPA